MFQNPGGHVVACLSHVYLATWAGDPVDSIILKSLIFCNSMSCNLVRVNRCFGGTCRLLLQPWRVSQARNQEFWVRGCPSLCESIFLFSVAWRWYQQRNGFEVGMLCVSLLQGWWIFYRLLDGVMQPAGICLCELIFHLLLKSLTDALRADFLIFSPLPWRWRRNVG
jgi:hypothetical protein